MFCCCRLPRKICLRNDTLEQIWNTFECLGILKDFPYGFRQIIQEIHSLHDLLRPRIDAKYCGEHVSMYVCARAYLENHNLNLTKLWDALCLSTWLGPLLASDSLRLLLRVLWMTSSFHIMAMSNNQRGHCVWRMLNVTHQGAAPESEIWCLPVSVVVRCIAAWWRHESPHDDDAEKMRSVSCRDSAHPLIQHSPSTAFYPVPIVTDRRHRHSHGFQLPTSWKCLDGTNFQDLRE